LGERPPTFPSRFFPSGRCYSNDRAKLEGGEKRFVRRTKTGEFFFKKFGIVKNHSYNKKNSMGVIDVRFLINKDIGEYLNPRKEHQLRKKRAFALAAVAKVSLENLFRRKRGDSNE